MADLPTGPFVAINDVETAQGAPVSEALAQKEGTNDNDLDDRATTNATNIATNVTNIATNVTNIATNVTNIGTNTTNIATNTGNIAALQSIEEFDFILNPTGVATTIFTFSATPTIIIVRTQSAVSAEKQIPVAILVTNVTTVRVASSSIELEYTLVGLDLKVRETSGTAGSMTFLGAGWV